MILFRKRERPLPERPEWAACIEGFRAVPVGVLVERGERRRLDDPLVQRFPAYWRALVPIEEVDVLYGEQAL